MSFDDSHVSRRAFLKSSTLGAAGLAITPSIAHALHGVQSRRHVGYASESAAQPGTYTLEITFFGLCLFVPDSSNQVHVLLPKIRPYSGVEDHFPILHFKDRGGDSPKCGYPIRDLPLNFASSTPAKTHFPRDLFKGNALWKDARVKRITDLVKDGDLAAHVILTDASYKSVKVTRGIWKLPVYEQGAETPTAKDVAFTPSLVWTVQMQGTTLPISTQVPGLHDLTPSNGTIRLQVRNVTQHDLPYCPAMDENPPTFPPSSIPHFVAYFPLFGEKTGPIPIWKCVEPYRENRTRSDPNGRDSECIRGMRPFTCMTLGGEF